MSEIASRGQLRMAFARVALVIVPFVLLLGTASGALSGSARHAGWYAALAKPSFMPPDRAFGLVWTLLYILIGVALAMIVAARSARGRGVAIALFAVQFSLNLCWSPLFFGAHRIAAAFVLILATLIASVVATLAMARVRRQAAALMLPYCAWLCFAAVLNFEIDRLNPDGGRLAPSASGTQITL